MCASEDRTRPSDGWRTKFFPSPSTQCVYPFWRFPFEHTKSLPYHGAGKLQRDYVDGDLRHAIVIPLSICMRTFLQGQVYRPLECAATVVMQKVEDGPFCQKRKFPLLRQMQDLDLQFFCPYTRQKCTFKWQQGTS